MRHPSVLLALLLLQSESSLALSFSFSPDDILHWFLNRGIQPTVAHTESSIGLAGYLPTLATSTSTPAAPTTTSVHSTSTLESPSPSTTVPTTKHGIQPGVVHTEESVGISISPSTDDGAEYGSTAHEEQPAPTHVTTPVVVTPAAVTHQAQPTPDSKAPGNTTPNGYTSVVPIAHTEAPAPTTATAAPPTQDQGPQGNAGSGGAGSGSSSPGGSSPGQSTSGGSGSTGSSGPSSAGSSASHANTGSQGNSTPASPGDDESSSGDASPEIGAPGWQSSPAAQVSSVPAIAASGSAGAFNLGSATVSYSAILGGVGSQAISAIAIGSQTATPGQTLTINSQAVVVSASGSSIFLAPVATVVPEPAPSSVTKVWTEGGKVVTGVFAAPTGTKASAFNAVPTATASAIQAGATAASEEAVSSAAATASVVASGMTTSTVASPSGGSGSPSGSTAAPTGAASRSMNAVTGSLVAAIAALMLLL